MEAFERCIYLHEINIPSSVTSIGQEAFADSGLLHLELPSNLESIGIRFLEDTPVKEITIPGTVKTLEWKYRESYGDTDDYGVFYGSGLESIVFQSGITEIPRYTCYKASKLKSVVLPDTLITIGVSAFEITALESLTLPEGVQNLGEYMLSNTPLKSIHIPKTVISGSGAFIGSEVTTVTLEDGLTAIPDRLLHSCKMTELEIPSSVTSIGQEAFAGSGLLHLELPSNLESIGIRFLEDTPVKEITIPGTVKTLEWKYRESYGDTDDYGVFYGSAVETVVLEEGITYVSKYMFLNATNLQRVYFPGTITSIGDYAFCQNDSLSDIYYYGTQDDWESITVSQNNDSLNENVVIHFVLVPEADIILPAALTTIETEAFHGISNEAVIFIPATVNSIADDAFDNGVIILTPYGSYASRWAKEKMVDCYETLER